MNRTDASSKAIRLLPGRLLSSILLLAGLLGLGSCSPADVPTADTPSAGATQENDSPAIRLPSIRLSNRAVIPIASLSSQRENETVAVSGTVAEKVAVLDGWLYKIEEQPASVWVRSSGSDPVVGESATVEGVVRYEEIVVGELNVGEVYLEELAYQSQGR